MSAINLQKDLEVWYDFDSRYWDAQRDLIQDRSGYGRHAEASGGPTIGVEGPNDFEAASFDGSDDGFNVGDKLNESNNQTNFALVKVDNHDDNYNVANNFDGSFGEGFWIRIEDDGVVRWSLKDGDNSNIYNLSPEMDFTQWRTIIGMFRESTSYLIIDGELVGTETADDSNLKKGESNVHIGIEPNDSDPLDGSIATFARWYRPLSWAEIQYLNNLTAPRRAML